MTLYRVLRPLLFTLPAETAHEVTFTIGERIARCSPLLDLLAHQLSFNDSRLVTSLAGIPLSLPVGVAAGFDKNARVIPLLAACGFGFVEVGSVTGKASLGNPRPRLFRLTKDRALINRLGLNNLGPEVIAARLAALTVRRDFVTAVNIAKTHDSSIVGEAAIADMAHAFDLTYDYARFIVLNVSCPNTSDGKTFETGSGLNDLLRRLFEIRHDKQTRGGQRKPLFVKFSPDLSDRELDTSLEICEDLGVDGYVFTNTTNSRSGLKAAQATIEKIGRGGLSGSPLLQLSLPRLERVYKLLSGKKPLIGVGGISTIDDAYRFFKAGASAIEVYTGLVYEGPGLAATLMRGVLNRLERDGAKNLAEIIGTG